LTIQRLKIALLVDTRHNPVLDVHRTTTRKHDPQIAPHPVARNTDRIAILVGDKGYNTQALRDQRHAAGIRPIAGIASSPGCTRRGMLARTTGCTGNAPSMSR